MVGKDSDIYTRADVDLTTLKVTSGSILSHPDENAEVRRWLAILSGRVACDLAASTGVHDWQTAVKDILLGANAIQVASAMYNIGPEVLNAWIEETTKWMESRGFQSPSEITGRLKQADSIKPLGYERAQFMRYFSDVR